MTSHHRSLPWLHDITIELQQMPLCWMRRMKVILGRPGPTAHHCRFVDCLEASATIFIGEGLGESLISCRFVAHAAAPP